MYFQINEEENRFHQLAIEETTFEGGPDNPENVEYNGGYQPLPTDYQPPPTGYQPLPAGFDPQGGGTYKETNYLSEQCRSDGYQNIYGNGETPLAGGEDLKGRHGRAVQFPDALNKSDTEKAENMFHFIK